MDDITIDRSKPEVPVIRYEFPEDLKNALIDLIDERLEKGLRKIEKKAEYNIPYIKGRKNLQKHLGGISQKTLDDLLVRGLPFEDLGEKSRAVYLFKKTAIEDFVDNQMPKQS